MRGGGGGGGGGVAVAADDRIAVRLTSAYSAALLRRTKAVSCDRARLSAKPAARDARRSLKLVDPSPFRRCRPPTAGASWGTPSFSSWTSDGPGAPTLSPNVPPSAGVSPAHATVGGGTDDCFSPRPFSDSAISPGGAAGVASPCINRPARTPTHSALRPSAPRPLRRGGSARRDCVTVCPTPHGQADKPGGGVPHATSVTMFHKFMLVGLARSGVIFADFGADSKYTLL